ncbi:NADH:flavin oxidoreductase/NADH oxidase [Mycena sanguinolenta]|uniref:NADH:flavin oxidoreductase/NADH oxidase n=1 Tax=Mycena sanguinolenta TaxID=230812 RepID=A0A8H6XU34_9AGAR|nr:NADH:flavin oxidoreductase/NADH oxidase [Mycena sanguinolenta]
MPPSLFQPLSIGSVSLQHRVVLAPLTRLRADANHVPLLPLVKEYYSQRASTPGTLLITEANIIAAKAGGYFNMPGIWSPEQIKAWTEVSSLISFAIATVLIHNRRKVVNGVHAKGSFIFLQLAALGRGAIPEALRAEDPTFSIVSASDIPIAKDGEKPRPLTVAEIQEYVSLYVQAAKNAMEAGFDGVEIHSANGCLTDQFLQDVSNNRTDAYGGSVENRARFPLEVVKAVAEAVGEKKTAIRFSPWSPFAGMGMADPVPTFSYIVSEIKRLFPDLAYIHLIEPRIAAGSDVAKSADNAVQSNDFLREIWDDRPLISGGGFSRETAKKLADKRKNALVAFGRHFIANPDLPLRLERISRYTLTIGPHSTCQASILPLGTLTSLLRVRHRLVGEGNCSRHNLGVLTDICMFAQDRSTIRPSVNLKMVSLIVIPPPAVATPCQWKILNMVHTGHIIILYLKVTLARIVEGAKASLCLLYY